MDDQQLRQLTAALERIAAALEASTGTGCARAPENWAASAAFVWDAPRRALKAIDDLQTIPLSLFVGIEGQMKTLLENTRLFAEGYPANNALLWGARGMGKSSLVKSVHAEISKTLPLCLIEIHREDIGSLALLLDLLRGEKSRRFILFCDDLSFDDQDSSYKSLKAALEGGIEGRPANVLIYATSNRRHLIPRQMIENERESAIHPGEAVEEKVSLSDRFGLWLGFYPCSQDEYLEMVRGYAALYGIPCRDAEAIEWFRTRGSRSGRTAWQFIQEAAGRHRIRIS
jgi:predicted AAA+ superfamily ATPase